MKIILYGKGNIGKRAYDYLANAEGIELAGVCEDLLQGTGDGKIVLAEASYNPAGVSVYPVDRLASVIAAGDADAVVYAADNDWCAVSVRRLLEKGVYQLCHLPQYLENPLYDITDQDFGWIEIEKPRLEYLEYHISFHCNLNCKGCSHFSNLVNEPRFGDYDRFCQDLIRLRELFWGIGKIRLMGGEPVLNPELPKFVYAAREAFPDADIRVVSNALMIRKEQTELFRAMRECAVYFDVSMYSPTAAVAPHIAEICKEEQVVFTVTPPVREFAAGMNLTGDSNPAASFRTCAARHCVYLCDGKISACAMPQLIGIYNEAYRTDITSGNRDVIDLYEPGLKGIDLIEHLKQPMEICRYCDVSRRSFPWEPGPHPKAEDWLAKV